MKRLFPLALLALAACSAGPRGPDYRGTRLKPAANPSAVIAAELAFAKLAQDKGQWTAFRANATDDAEMFVPQRVRAQDWLKGRADPPAAIKWQPYAVWSSCDGSYAVTRGGWTSDRGAGFFNTVWQRQRDGAHKWVIDLGDDAPATSQAPEMIAARVASCPAKGQVLSEPAAVPAPGIDSKMASSQDRSLVWTSQVLQDGSHRLVVQLWNGEGYDKVIDSGAGSN